LQDRVRAGPGPDRGVDVVAVAEAVDQTRLEGLAGEQRRPVDQALDDARVEAAVGGDRGHELLHDRLHDPLGRLAVSGREPSLGEDVPGVLVLVALGDLGGDPGLVEHAPEERHLGGDAREAQITRRLQPDLLEARRQEVRDAAVAELPEGLGPGDRELAVVADIAHRILQLLGLCQAQGRPRPAQLDHQGPDPGVPRRPAQSPEDGPQRRAAPGEERPHRILRRLFQQGLGEVELQHEVGGPPASRLVDPGDHRFGCVLGSGEHGSRLGGRRRRMALTVVRVRRLSG
jgi:hypothetical protein